MRFSSLEYTCKCSAKNCHSPGVGIIVVVFVTVAFFRRKTYLTPFVALLVFSLCPLDISVGVGAFVIGLSQISSFLSLGYTHTN